MELNLSYKANYSKLAISATDKRSNAAKGLAQVLSGIIPPLKAKPIPTHNNQNKTAQIFVLPYVKSSKVVPHKYNKFFEYYAQVKRFQRDKKINSSQGLMLNFLLQLLKDRHVAVTTYHDLMRKLDISKQTAYRTLKVLEHIISYKFYNEITINNRKCFNKIIIQLSSEADNILKLAIEKHSNSEKKLDIKEHVNDDPHHQECRPPSSQMMTPPLWNARETRATEPLNITYRYNNNYYSVCLNTAREEQNTSPPEQPKVESTVQTQPKEVKEMQVFNGGLTTGKTANIYDIFKGVVNRPLQNMNNPIRTNENRYNAPLPPYGQSKYTHDYGHDRIQKLLTLIPREFSPKTSALLKEQQYFYSEADNKLTIRVKTKPQLTEDERNAFIKLTVSVFGEAPYICYQRQKPMPKSEETEYVPKPVYQVNEPLHWPADEMLEHHPDYWERLRMSLAGAYGRGKVNAWLRDTKVIQVGKVIIVTCTQCTANYIADNFLSRLQDFCRENHGVTIRFEVTDIIGQKSQIEITERGKFCESLKKPNNDWMRQ